MIVKGKSRNNAAQAGSYLLKQGKNERVELIETRGTLAQDVKGACIEMEALAAGSNAEKPFYHASINPAKGERLTPEQWEISTDLLEKKLELEGHQRIVVEHEKNGGVHRHIFWNRVNQENLKAVRMGWNYVQHEQTAREIENAFGLEKVQGVHTKENGELREKGDPRAHYAPTHKETEDAKKTGVNLKKWEKEIRGIAAGVEGKSGAELIAALEAKGHMVAKGDKVAFVILDPSGKAQRMAQRLAMGVDDLKEKLTGIERETLPNEIQARELQKARLVEIGREAEDSRGKITPIKEWRSEIQGIINNIYNRKATGVELIAALYEQGHVVAINAKGAFFVFDPYGMSRCLENTAGLSTGALKARLADVDRAILPNVEQVAERFDQAKEKWKEQAEEAAKTHLAERREKGASQTEAKAKAPPVAESLQEYLWRLSGVESSQEYWARLAKEKAAEGAKNLLLASEVWAKEELTEDRREGKGILPEAPESLNPPPRSYRSALTLYGNSSMASQQKDALIHIVVKKKQQRADQQPKNVLPELKKKQQPTQAGAAKEDFTPQPLQKREKSGAIEKEKQVTARTEQTDAKKQKSAGDIAREIHEANINRRMEQMHNMGIHSRVDKERVRER